MTILLMGSVYKFSKRAWKNFLDKWIETGEMPHIDRYATMITAYARNITDLGIEDVVTLREEAN
jgi:hypothetical protein